ncbi:MAG: peptidoglycan-associated lipoprotein Pal [Acidobacteria bacterium]|nr:peptidoglycan-associated lipoprotein Pal [Acidobacteriota bacterium]MBI3657090.1 peptidoglycan-associated lipoprotein Pal [Acidobacteriota bacterium]
MRTGTFRFVLLWSFLTVLVALTIVGCGPKKVAVTPPKPSETIPAPTGPPPSLTLIVSPSAIEKGQSATLTWNAGNAQAVTIDPIGPVTTSGSKTVSPETSTTYMGRATAPNQTAAEATARLTVAAPSVDSGSGRSSSMDEKGLDWEKDVREIHFDYDRYEIRPEDQNLLKKNAGVFKGSAYATVIIEGHCDERGTEEYNQALGDRRATATKEYLVKQGVSANRMTTVSFGESKPLDPGHNEAAWAKNRRAHFSKK